MCKLKNLLFFSLFVFMLNACAEQDKTTTIKFFITNPISGKGVKNIPVKIIEENMKDNKITKRTVIESFTNKEGLAVLKFDAKKEKQFLYFPTISKSFFNHLKKYELLIRPIEANYSIKKNQLNIVKFELMYSNEMEQDY